MSKAIQIIMGLAITVLAIFFLVFSDSGAYGTVKSEVSDYQTKITNSSSKLPSN